MADHSPLPYATVEPAITRRAFRLLLLLTLINTILLGTFVLGPGIGPYLKQLYRLLSISRRRERSSMCGSYARKPFHEGLGHDIPS